MRGLLLLSMLLCGVLSVRAQDISWSEDIAPLVYDNCSRCHHEGSSAHFSLMSYEDFVEHSLGIYYAVQDGEMPPWPADPEYRHFIGETVLSPEEVSKIVSFIDDGMPVGNTDLEPEPPVFGEGGSLLESVDLVAAIEPYEVQFNGEEYRWFSIPTNFTETKYIQAVEVIPGLSEAVHHADIHVDATGESAITDALDPLPGFNSNTGWPTATTYVNAWQPGAGPARFPDNWGIPIPPGAHLLIEIHYGFGFAGEVDNTVMNLEFVDEPENVRPISVGWLMGSGSMTDGPLVIPPNQISIFHQEAYPFWNDKSLLAICPHMHLLGESYQVWMETPDQDSIPLIDIPDWDFRWQFYYYFQQPQLAPAGSALRSIGRYDNTVNNPYNPNSPPVTVYDGALTTDEMFLCYFIYANYEDGDEDIILDPDLITSVEEKKVIDLKMYPNPATDQLRIELPMISGLPLLRITDSYGRTVREELVRPGSSIQNIQDLSPGNYYVQLQSEGQVHGGWFTKVE